MLEWGRRSGGVVEIVSEGQVVATARPSAFRERAEATVDGCDWSYYKKQGRLLGERVGAPQPTLRRRST